MAGTALRDHTTSYHPATRANETHLDPDGSKQHRHAAVLIGVWS
jgi:hypothetical protein